MPRYEHPIEIEYNRIYKDVSQDFLLEDEELCINDLRHIYGVTDVDSFRIVHDDEDGIVKLRVYKRVLENDEERFQRVFASMLYMNEYNKQEARRAKRRLSNGK